MRFLEKKQKKQIWKKAAKSKKKIYEKSWTATASVSKRPKEKVRAFWPRGLPLSPHRRTN
jgi:hypothetical protein